MAGFGFAALLAPPQSVSGACIRVEVAVDPAASFEEYVHAQLGALSRAAYLMTADRQLAEDLVQTALIRVAAYWERIVAGGDPHAYVRRVLYTVHVSWWRRRKLHA